MWFEATQSIFLKMNVVQKQQNKDLNSLFMVHIHLIMLQPEYMKCLRTICNCEPVLFTLHTVYTYGAMFKFNTVETIWGPVKL